MKRAAKEMEEMWNAALPEVQTSYPLNDMTSGLPLPMAGSFHSQSDVIKPVIDVVAHALCSGRPKVRYLVDGVGFRCRFVDEYNVRFLLRFKCH